MAKNLLSLVLVRQYYLPTELIFLCEGGVRLSPAERRRSPRMRLQIPLFIRGVDSSGTLFLDLTKSLDISGSGALLAASRHVSEGTQLQLTIPAPSPSNSTYSNIPPETPPIQARVRRHASDGDIHFIGVEFLKPLDY